ncbi:acyl-CoA dehydrogenase family protein [Xanthobacteraceae bacterium A53D]
MSEMDGVIRETVSRLFSAQVNHEMVLAARTGHWPESVWAALAELGLPMAMVDEADGGIGLSPAAALDIIRLAGGAALPLPLGETMVSLWLARLFGLDAPDGPLTFVAQAGDASFAVSGAPGALRLSGQAARVPSARHAAAIILLAQRAEGWVGAVIPRDQFRLTEGGNLSGEPRDTIETDVEIDDAWISDPVGLRPRDLLAIGAALRCAAMAGAIEQILASTVAYADEREQFGKAIGRQQVIQHAIAQLAGEAAAARAAAELAAGAISSASVSWLKVAAAKARGGEAAGKAAAIAHQVHGAIGFTREHRLHDLTTRLWSWRDECGNERFWSTELGRAALAEAPEAYWPFVTGLAAAAPLETHP